MSETIDKLATQHKVIGAKTDCNYFSNIGNLCSRVENGMMRCDEYLECEFKYIDALKEENEKQKEILKEIKQIATNQDLYRGRQALATKILQIIENVDKKESEQQ